MANYQTQFSCRLAVGAGNVEAALALYAQMQAELGDIDIGFEAERNGPEDNALWLWDGDGAGDVEDVIAFTLRCAAAFNLTGLWGFCWSLSCDRPRLDSNGGGAQLLDLGQRESLGWIDCQHWLAMRLGTGEPRAVLAETAPHPDTPGASTGCALRNLSFHLEMVIWEDAPEGFRMNAADIAQRMKAATPEQTARARSRLTKVPS